MMAVMALGVRRVVVVCLVVMTGLLAAGSASAATPVKISPRIIGGGDVAISDAPWQVALVDHLGDPFYTQFCGGVIISERRIITAAHCLDREAPEGVVDEPGTVDVVAGITDLSAPEDPSVQRVEIEGWTPMPVFSFTSNVPRGDVAVATLKAPLDLSGPDVQPAALVGADQRTPPGTTVRVSGWGLTETDPEPVFPDILQAVDLLTVSDQSCATRWGSRLDFATMLCAVAPGKDSCDGDSGGPLSLTDGTLVGLVSFGANKCADANATPGIYTELADPAIAAFIRAPQPLTTPTLVGTAKSGEVLVCQPGSWASTVAGSPAIDFSFVTTDGVTLRDWSQDASYTLGAGDAGRSVMCAERATDPSGSTVAQSPASAAVVGPPAPPTPPAVVPVPKPVDTAAPRTTFVSIRCKARRCVVRLRVADRGTPLSGVKRVRVTVLPGRGAVKTVTAKKIAQGIYEARFTRVARGPTWFSAAALDVAGNRSPEPAIKRARVK